MGYAAESDDEIPDGERDPRITRAIKFMQRVAEADTVNRVNAQMWRKFRYGEQWPPEIQNSRTLEQRPCLTINKVDPYCKQVENQQRQQRPRIKVDPTNTTATKKNAEIIKGMIRHIESARGGADMAYDGGFSSAVTEGVGYWRVMSDYVRDNSFEKELFLAPIDDPNSVYYDDHSIMPDGSDAEEVLIVTDMARDAFKFAHPSADPGDQFRATNDTAGEADWLTKDTVRVAEYFTIEHKMVNLVSLSSGESGWEDRMLPLADLKARGITVTRSEKRDRKTVKWCKITALDVLDEQELPGRWIPVFPCYGEITIIDGKRRRSGLLKNAIDPQRMINFFKSYIVEAIALAAKAKWVMAEGQQEGHENEWRMANVTAMPYLLYKPMDVSGQPAAPPQRIQPEPPPEGAIALVQSLDNDLSTVLGIVDPAMRIGGNVSGKALQSERMQSDQSTFHLYDNMTRSIAFTGRYLLDVMKYYYNEPGRVVRIIGDDGQSSTKQLNVQQPGATAEDPSKVLNDVTVGEYDVVMDTGPGFNTKRQEAVDSMMPLFEKNEDLMKIAGDVMFRNMDFPGAEVIADRMAAANPMSQIDEESDVPPQAQMQIKQLQDAVKKLTEHAQQLEQVLKSRADVEAAKQAGESHRLLVKEAGATDRNNADNESWMHDVAVKSHTALGVAEINQAGKIITQTKDHAHASEQFEKTADREDRQLEAQTESNA